MLLIRAHQETRLREGARNAFLARVEQHIAKAYPKRIGTLDPADLRQFVERNWEAARGFGLTSERSLCGYLEIVCQLGDDFPERHSWAGAILRGADYEDRKLTKIREKLNVPGTGNGATAHDSRE